VNLRSLTQLVPDPEKFLSHPPEQAEVWHMPAEPLTTLLTLSDLDRLLADGLPRGHGFRMVKDGKDIEPQRFTWADHHVETAFQHATRAAGVAQELRDGATIILNNLQRIWRPIGDLCRRLSFETGHHIYAFAFLTPPGSKGLNYHVDFDSAFLVQLAGSKRWQVHEPVYPGPLQHQTDSPWTTSPAIAAEWERIQQSPPAVDTVLRPGDVLWVPRGWIHRGFTTDELSLHLCLPFALVTPYWLVGHIAARLDEFASVRRELPWGLARDRQRLAGVIDDVIAELVDILPRMDRTALADQVTTALRRDFHEPVRTPVTSVLGSRIDLDTPVVMVAEAAPCGPEPQPDGAVRFTMRDTTLTLRGVPARVTAARWAMDSPDPWRARDLLGDGLTETTAITLVTELLHTGLARHHLG